MLAVPIWLIVIFLVYALVHGPATQEPIVVNDDPSCESGPLTIQPAELATRKYWEEC